MDGRKETFQRRCLHTKKKDGNATNGRKDEFIVFSNTK